MPDSWPTFGSRDRLFYETLRHWIEQAGVLDGALAAGARSPDFLLPDERGRLVSLQDLLAAGPVVLNFLGGIWSTFCISKLKTLDDARDAIQELGADLLTITPATGDYPRTLKKRHRIQSRLLSDVDYGVGLLFGLVYAVPSKTLLAMEKRGVDLAKLHGTSTPMLPLPATYVIDSSGIVAAAFLGADLTASIEPSAILEALRGIEPRKG